MGIVIRPVKWNDFEDIVKNYYAFYEEIKTDPYFGITLYDDLPDIPSEINWFMNLIISTNLGEAIAIVAEDSGRVVGLCDIHNKRPNTELSHIGVLGIAIAKEYRDRGIGTLMIEKAIELSKSKFKIIVLEVFSSNERAIHLYEKLGFKKYGYLSKAIKRNGEYLGEFQMYLEL